MIIKETENIFSNSLLKLLLCLQAKEEFQHNSAADRQTVEKVKKRDVNEAHISQAFANHSFFLNPGSLINNLINKLKLKQPGPT